jgi:hypothetical protein
MKYLLALLLLVSNLTYSQAINDRWVGVWQSGATGKLTVSPSKFGACQWVNKVTAAQKKCLAYYNGKISKKEMVADLNNDLKNLSGWLKDKSITAADFQKMKADSESYKKILDEISDDTFRMVFVDYGEMANPDGGSAYFLDKEFVYETSHVEGGIGPAFSITKYKKQ